MSLCCPILKIISVISRCMATLLPRWSKVVSHSWSSDLWPCTSLPPVNLHLYSPGEPSTGHSTPDVVSKALSKEIRSPPWPANNSLPNAAKDAVGLLCHEGTLLANDQLGINQDPKILLREFAFQLVASQEVLMPLVFLPRCRTLYFSFVKLHEIPLSPILQHIQVPLNGGTTIWPISCSSQYLSSANLPKVHSVPVFR